MDKSPVDAKLDVAIAAAERHEKEAVDAGMYEVTLASGRVMQIVYPLDTTRDELLDFMGWVAKFMPGHLDEIRRERERAAGIPAVTPSGIVLPGRN